MERKGKHYLMEKRLDPELLRVVLSFLHLPSTDSCRKVSRKWNTASIDAKKQFLEKFTAGQRVELCGLQSRKDLNGQIGRLDARGRQKNGRFGVVLLAAITGDRKILALKITNLLPAGPAKPMVEYSTTGVVRTSHGILLDHVLVMGRFGVNLRIGPFVHDDDDDGALND